MKSGLLDSAPDWMRATGSIQAEEASAPPRRHFLVLDGRQSARR